MKPCARPPSCVNLVAERTEEICHHCLYAVASTDFYIVYLKEHFELGKGVEVLDLYKLNGEHWKPARQR